MAFDFQQERQQTHALLDPLSPAKLGLVRSLLEVMVDEDDNEELTAEDIPALRASDERLCQGGHTVLFEQLVDELGCTMEQVSSG